MVHIIDFDYINNYKISNFYSYLPINKLQNFDIDFDFDFSCYNLSLNYTMNLINLHFDIVFELDNKIIVLYTV
jgi:hypothetical protein